MAAKVPEISTESIDYVYVDVTADVDLNAQPVAMAFLPDTEKPTALTTWTAAAWTGGVGKTRPARILVGPGKPVQLTPDVYRVWVKVTDSVVAPVLPAGLVEVV